MHSKTRILAAALASVALLSGCPADDSSSSVPGPQSEFLAAPPQFPADPSQFVEEIDNPYLGFARGRVFTYEELADEGGETIVVEVTNDTKTILGVATTVVHDQVFVDGDLIEDTFDWYAQDVDGNVWYFGEDSKEMENGEVVSTEGSWEAGVNGAMPGIAMLAKPKLGQKYQQEFAVGVAEDMAQIKSLKTEVEVPFGSFDGCLETKEWTPLHPGGSERKIYAPGVGLVLELSSKGLGHQRRTELVSIEE